MLNPFNLEWKEFIDDLDIRLNQVTIELSELKIDHVCYRVGDFSTYTKLLDEFISISRMHITNKHNDRNFTLVVLEEPFRFAKNIIPYVEISEPGGSEQYRTGFQHIEVLHAEEYSEIAEDSFAIEKYLVSSKSNSTESYLKWEDTTAFKITKTPLITKFLSESDSKIMTM